MKIKKVLGDVIVVEHIDNKASSSLLHIPDIADTTKVGPTKAVVHHIGSKCIYLNELNKGDVVIVPAQLGTRLPPDKKLIAYDSCDVLAVCLNKVDY